MTTIPFRSIDDFDATGTPSASTFLRGDKTWASPTASVAISSTSVAFTDGDCAKRVSISDVSVGATDKVLVTLRRPDIADDSADTGHIYLVNVVRVYSGGFDVVIVALDLSGDDTTEYPPNETVQLFYQVAA